MWPKAIFYECVYTCNKLIYGFPFEIIIKLRYMYSKFFKRILDILFSLCILPFILLEILILAPIIYIGNPGPIFYNAPRMGRNGRIFKMFKLRSMYVNAPDIRNEDGSTFNSNNDPRVTKVGKFLRNTSLDEFPQFLNVLLGDMSLIGPRPTIPTSDYKEMDEQNKKRLSVRPGVTGYVQAYYRNSIPAIEKLKYNCFYVDNLSFNMDMKIFFQTIKSVLLRQNINTHSL